MVADLRIFTRIVIPRPRLAVRREKTHHGRVSEFLQRAADAVCEHQLLAPGQKVLAAVSGGVDSMVLLHALHALARKNRWSVTVAHFDHRLRGRASQADEALVRRTAARLRLPFVAGGADVQKIAAQGKISIEMAARKLRHEFLARTARAQGIPAVALAHHADDQVELFFLRLLRGAGSAGLAGMKWRSISPADKTIALVRPLLAFTKAELLAVAAEKSIAYRTDATNFSPDILRNRVRNELLPLIREHYQPAIDSTILRLMDIAGAEAEFVSAAASQVATSSGTSPGAAPAFEALALAVQRKWLQQQLTAAGLAPDFELINQLRGAPGKRVSVAPGLTVERDAAGRLCCREPVAAGFNSAGLELNLSGAMGRREFAGLLIGWRVEPMKQFKLPRKKPSAAGPSATRECFDAARIGEVIVLRHWQPGDRFQPIGMQAPVKLQDLFVNAKIPLARRRELVLAATRAGEIFWVEGLRMAEPFKLTDQTRTKLVWQASRA